MQSRDAETRNHCPRCGTSLLAEEPGGICPRCIATVLFGPTDAPPVAPAARPEPLRQLGDYELLAEIARGGMGIVYRARQRGLNRAVAVKLMRDSALARPEDVKRFRAEAAAAAKLKHPHIIGIHEVGEEAGQHFFAMDLVEGLNLADRTRAGPLPAREAAQLVATVADAVQHAHEQGVLHRDLKPSNVLVDPAGQPFVTDFGLARPLDANSSLTMTGRVLGTPGYMPPEQAVGRGTVGPAADIYSLGALLYHLVTGRAPFVAANVGETLRQVLEQEPVPPPLLNPEVPRDLTSVCLKSLAKRPADRYASASALAEDLRRFLRGEPTLARPAGLTERLVRWARRKPALATAVAAATLVAIVGFAGITWQWRRAVQAGLERREQLWRSQLFEARAHRISREPGQRLKALETLARASAYRPSLELRNEAIAALLLPDLAPRTNWHAARLPHGPLAYTSDFQFCVAHRRDGQVAVLDSRDASPVAEMPGGGAEIAWLQFSPDDRWLGAAFKDGSVRVWDWRQRALQVSWTGAAGAFNRPPFDFEPAGRSLIRTADSSVERLSLADDARPFVLLTNTLHSVRLSPSGRSVALSRDALLELWNLEPPRMLARHQFDSSVAAVAWHPHEETVAVGTDANGFYAWDFTVSPPRHVGSVHAAVTHAFFNGTGDLLVASGWGDVTEIWDTRDWGLLLRSAEGFAKQLSRDGRWLAVAREGAGFGMREFLEPRGLRQWSVPPSLKAPTESARFSRDGRWLATAHHGGWLLWDARSGRIVARRAGGQVQSCELAPDFSAVYTCDTSGVRRWPVTLDTGTGLPDIGPPELLFTNAPPHLDRVALTTDGGRLVAVGEGAGVVLELASGQSHWIADWAQRPAHWLAVSPDAKWLAAGFHHATDLHLYRLAPAPEFVTSVPTGGGRFAFSPNGRRLAAGAREALTFWETGTWRLLARLPSEPPSRAAEVAGYSPDGTMLWVNNADRMVGLRDAATGGPLAVLRSPTENLAWSVVYDPVGRRCVATTARPALAVWQLDELRTELRRLGLDWSTGDQNLP